ncbi:unnamed protein product [Spirodela intermedia]|uniref:Uncharacterized protein n=1 Tax=Spirodela intermedia TaxID=51605 RepID=A0A7I8INC9_SPIIN|nr:unnamed protein product [Spirodela intermedia]CAA6659477.1 unnamed protein product [Spirodela intermedia]
MLAHAVAHVASAIKMRESGTSGKGIESVISGVERLIAAGKLAEAADALERGVSGTEAGGAVNEWVRLARDRAITEQALIPPSSVCHFHQPHLIHLLIHILLPPPPLFFPHFWGIWGVSK